MSDYKPPVKEMSFILNDVLGFTHEELDRETVEAVFDEAAKLASMVLAPLNKSGDAQGASLIDGEVKGADGFKEAYKAYCDGGWNAVPFDETYGGQGLPWALAFPVQEMWQSANMAFGLCPLLNQGAIEAILAHSCDEQKDKYLPKLISGEWSGTMNITESQAGSDLGLIRTKAEKQSDGSYKITGQKNFITYGDHDMADNIIHLVLARALGAPEDVKGLSLFIVPKILDDGSKNNVQAIGLEDKLGIHASPTCTMDFDGAIGYLVGEENSGLKYMFTMMNNARLCVGLQGVAIAERAYQHAYIYANQRVQGRSFDDGARVVIAKHADVRRMLMDMKSRIIAGRLMAYSAAMELDRSSKSNSGDNDDALKKVDFLTPIVKSFCTDMAVEVASTGIQIHGGMGFIEESGAAQYYRDARILPIYEGTNGIQAADFAFRKVAYDGGVIAHSYIKEMAGLVEQSCLDNLSSSTDKILDLAKNRDMDAISWISTPYLKAFSFALGGALIEKSIKVDKEFKCDLGIKLKDISDFYKANILPLSYI